MKNFFQWIGSICLALIIIAIICFIGAIIGEYIDYILPGAVIAFFLLCIFGLAAALKDSME